MTGLSSLFFVPAVLTRSWPLPQWLCSATGYLTTLGSGGSLFSLAALSVERSVVITNPLTNHRLVRRRNAALSLAFVWLYASAMPIWSFFSRYGNLYAMSPGSFICCVRYERSIVSSIFALAHSVLVSGSLILVSWLLIVRSARRHRARMDVMRRLTLPRLQSISSIAATPASASARKQFRTIAAITLFFYACWLPFGCRQLQLALAHAIPSPFPDFLIDWLALSFGLGNTAIYALTDRSYRNVAAQLLACRWPTRRLSRLSARLSSPPLSLPRRRTSTGSSSLHSTAPPIPTPTHHRPLILTPTAPQFTLSLS